MSTFEKINTATVTRAYRQGWLAWLGANKTAFTMAQSQVEKLNSSSQELMSSLVAKGQDLEDQAQNRVTSAKEYIKPRFENARSTVSTVSSKIFTPDANSSTQLETLSEEIAKLSQTVVELTEKVNAPRTRTAKKTAEKEEVAA